MKFKLIVSVLFILVFSTFVFSVTVFGQVSTCTQTLSVGANIAGSISSATNGSTICLNSGNYGTVNLWNINRSGFVTLQSTTGTTAVMSPSVGNSKYIKFVDMTLSNVVVNNCSIHIHFINTPFVADAPGIVITNNGYSCAGGNQDYLIDSADFSKVTQAGYEGRLSLIATNGVVVKNSMFSGVSTANMSTGPADGIFLGGGATNSTIGPNNTFTGIAESLCGSVHCDAIQIYGAGSNNIVTENFFSNGDTFIMAPDGSNAVTVTNNVFDGTSSGYQYKIQFGSAISPIFEHNTLKDAGVAFDSKTGNPASSNVIARNNIMAGGLGLFKTIGGSGCVSCAFTYNLFTHSANATGTNNIIDVPTWSGGTSPSTWTTWQLTPSSFGYQGGNDGQDMGANYYGSIIVVPPPTPPPPPTISSISSGTPTTTGTTIRWTTDEYADTQVEYGLTTAYGSNTALITTPTTSHSQSLTGLSAGTLYHFRVRSADAAGNTTTSSDNTFTTIASVIIPPPVLPTPTPVNPPVVPPSGGGGGVLPLSVIPNTTSGTPTPPPSITPPLPVSPTPTTTQGITLTQTLSLGSKGTQVTTLQNYLISLGYLAQGNNDGNYGPRTQRAVQQYQCKSMNICSGSTTTNGYGMVGIKTRASLSGGGSPQTGLTAAQRAAIQAQINQLLILVQQLVVQLKVLKGL